VIFSLGKFRNGLIYEVVCKGVMIVGSGMVTCVFDKGVCEFRKWYGLGCCM